MSIEQATLGVEGMRCHHCTLAVEQALRRLPGVREVKVDLAAKHVEVFYMSESISLQDIIRAINEAGYEATVAS
jgi:Cu+-exporting ATPase